MYAFVLSALFMQSVPIVVPLRPLQKWLVERHSSCLHRRPACPGAGNSAGNCTECAYSPSTMDPDAKRRHPAHQEKYNINSHLKELQGYRNGIRLNQ